MWSHVNAVVVVGIGMKVKILSAVRGDGDDWCDTVSTQISPSTRLLQKMLHRDGCDVYGATQVDPNTLGIAFQDAGADASTAQGIFVLHIENACVLIKIPLGS
jgi:hypothetical protein